MTAQSGPLKGIRILEFAGIGPGPFCAMLLSDLGAEVLRIDRKGSRGAAKTEFIARGRGSLVLDLKDPDDLRIAKQAIANCDALIEGFRPGVMERIGLSPEECLSLNPRLVYGRMTGWGQEGPLARAAGHDINYIAITGALAAIGPAKGPPIPPLNLLGDFAGGSLYLAMGILAALLEARQSGRGQVVDAAIVDGVTSLSAMIHWLRADGHWTLEREANMLDGGAHFYRCYVCADGKAISIGSVEPQFYALLLDKLGVTDAEFERQQDAAAWPHLASRLEALFRTHTRDEWCSVLEGTDACFAPVLDYDEAPHHPHNKARGNHIVADGTIQPAPAPRFSRTPGAIQGPPPAAGEAGQRILDRWLLKDAPAYGS